MLMKSTVISRRADNNMARQKDPPLASSKSNTNTLDVDVKLLFH
jgi:hypothetical protein